MQEQNNSKKKDQKIDGEQKKKVSLIKKKPKSAHWNKIYQNIDLKHIMNFGDLIFLNENALKDPQHNDSLLSAIFYYKMISKVAINQDNVTITIKNIDDNVVSPEYFIERLRSYGDTQFYNLSNDLEKLNQHLSSINQNAIKQTKQYKKQNFSFDEELRLMNQALISRKGKMYLIFFSQISPSGVMLKKIVISTGLLKQLGYDIDEIALNFIKYKHIFFQIFTARMYLTMIQHAVNKMSAMTQSLMQKQISENDFSQLNKITYVDQMIRRTQVNGSYQQELYSVNVKWCAPHPSVSIFDIEDLKELNLPYFTGVRKIRKLELPNNQSQLKSLQHLTKIDPSLLDQNKNRCCTFKIIKHQVQNSEIYNHGAQHHGAQNYERLNYKVQNNLMMNNQVQNNEQSMDKQDTNSKK